MQARRWLVAFALLFLVTVPVQAGIFFNRHAKAKSADVPALVTALRTEQDERKRAAAAEKLRQYDPNAHPEIVPALVDAAMGDPKSGVRLEALQTLARYRPVSPQAGWALEQATVKDESMRVRFQARSLLWQYRMAGYRSPKADSPAARGPATRREPPLAAPAEAPAGTQGATVIAPASEAVSASGARPTYSRRVVTPRPTSSPLPPSTAEPPLLPKEGDGPDIKPPR